MRKEFSTAIYDILKKSSETLFMTGDLGYMAFENIRDAFPDRFINAGVAEQNMVSVGAGLAYSGMQPWLYSIAPFITLKTYEQLRNDIDHTESDVKIVGNGGGYGYGLHGATHHILEDIALFHTLPNFTSYVPAFAADIFPIVTKMHTSKKPAYLRLGYSNSDIYYKEYSSVREIISGNDIVLVALGPLIHNAIEAVKEFQSKYVESVSLWSITELPFIENKQLIKKIIHAKKVLIIEETVEVGGLGHHIFAHKDIHSNKLQCTHLYAKGYVSKLYGNQEFHRGESNIHAQGILKHLEEFIA